MTTVLVVDHSSPDREIIARAAECLRSGGLVAFPTETVYGLGVNALDAIAVRRVFEAKGRPATDPLIVHVADLNAIQAIAVDVSGDVGDLASRFWPGPLTLVLKRSSQVPDEVTAGLDTVAVRVPRHPVAQALLLSAAVPVAAPSANLFSRPSPTSASHVLEDLNGRIDLILDGGMTTVGVESTVLDLSGSVPTILRPGAITREMLLQVLDRVDHHGGTASSGQAQRAPGMLEKHYSPRTPLTLYDGPDALRLLMSAAETAVAGGSRVGLLVATDDMSGEKTLANRCVVRELGPRPEDIARGLYSALRELDAAGVDHIFARTFPASDGLGEAIADRLRRAAAGRTVRS